MGPWGRHVYPRIQWASTIKIKLSVSFVEIIMVADLYNFITSLGKLNYVFAKSFYWLCNIKNMYHWFGSPWCVSDWNNNNKKTNQVANLLVNIYWFGPSFVNLLILLSLSEIYTGKVNCTCLAGANKNSYRKCLIIEVLIQDILFPNHGPHKGIIL